MNLVADKSIPKEVVMNTTGNTSNVDKAGTGQAETTPDKKQGEDESNISSMDKNDAAMPLNINDNEAKDADGFQTLSRKHRASVGSVEAVMKMEGVVEKRNPYAALTSLGMT
jgi:hypothetical protein